MSEIMIWLEENATYENLVMLANIIATVSIGVAFVTNYVKNTKEKILGATKVVNGVNSTIQPVLQKTIDGSLVGLSEEIKRLRFDNQRLLQATVLVLSGDPESRIAAIKLLSETKEVPVAIVKQATETVIEEIKVAQAASELEAAKQVAIEQKIEQIKETL